MRSKIRMLFFPLIMLLVVSCGDDGPAERDPMIDEIHPESGPPGTSMTISGSDFSPTASENTVTFSGSTAEVQEASESQLVAAVPEEAESGEVKVTVDGNTASGPQFTVESEAPGISSVEPDSGTVGTEVTIEGMNFSATASENTITFSGTDAPINSAAEDELITEVPEGAEDGPVEVTVDGETATGPEFDVITKGALQAMTTTSGDDQNDSYDLSVNGNTQSIAGNDTVFVGDLEEGSYQTELSDIAENCSVAGNNPRNVGITAGDTTSTIFEVNCSSSGNGGDASALNNKIVYQSDGETYANIYVMNADGSNVQKLTDDSSYDTDPVISNDGTKIAFTSNRNGDTGSFGIFIMDADGSNVREVVSDYSRPSSPYLSWSPDDSKLAFHANPQFYNNIYTVNTDGTNRTQVTSHDGFDASPSWSPDKDRIAFSSDRDGGADIYTINPDGTDPELITENSDAENYRARWSPNGSQFVFVSNRDGNAEVYTIDTDGTNVQRITNDSESDDYPAWSPDGSEIIFQTSRDAGNTEIYKTAADGSGSNINLTDDSALDEAPFWSPVK